MKNKLNIVIVNYGMGNLNSIKNMFRRIGYDSVITGSINQIKEANKIVLPGVGSFDNAMDKLDGLGLVSVLNQKVLTEKVHIMGICLGMQLMTKQSEEGKKKGFGWIQAKNC